MVRLPRAAQQPFHDLLRQVRGLVPRQVRRRHAGHGPPIGDQRTGMDLPEMRPPRIRINPRALRPLTRIYFLIFFFLNFKLNSEI